MALRGVRLSNGAAGVCGSRMALRGVRLPNGAAGVCGCRMALPGCAAAKRLGDRCVFLWIRRSFAAPCRPLSSSVRCRASCFVPSNRVPPSRRARAMGSASRHAPFSARPGTAPSPALKPLPHCGIAAQVRVAPDEEVATALLRALHESGELDGRSHGEISALDSLPGCRQQRLHWDFNPDLCEGLVCKPASVILGMQCGARLMVRDERANATVPIVLGPGDVLVFEGDVAHAGASYCARNMRVHVYLDVAGVVRARDFTWFRR